MIRKPDLDFDEQARLLWARLNLDPESHRRGQWNPIDPIWRHPITKGIIYVGNQTAAENLSLLQSNGITHVVNCTTGESRIPNFHEGALKYYVFPVCGLKTTTSVFLLKISFPNL